MASAYYREGMPMCEAAGALLSYHEHGSGPAVLLIHGIAGDGASWDSLIGELGSCVRTIAYDRRGYGDSGAPEPYGSTTVAEQAEDAAVLLRTLAPDGALVCGDGFGGLVTLDLLKRHAGLVSAAVVCDPPLFAFVPAAAAVLGAERELLDNTLRKGGPAAAVEAWLGGRVNEPTVARATVAHQAFFADYAGLASWPVRRADLRAISVPVAVLTGPGSPPHVLAAADALAGLLPDPRRAHDGRIAAAIRPLLGS